MKDQADAKTMRGAVPLGYRRSADGGIEIDPVTGPLVREAFEMAANGKHSLRQIIAVVSGKGLRTKRGNVIGTSAFAAMLGNPFYIGKISFDGTSTTGLHETLASPPVFRAAKRAMALRRRNF